MDVVDFISGAMSRWGLRVVVGVMGGVLVVGEGLGMIMEVVWEYIVVRVYG